MQVGKEKRKRMKERERKERKTRERERRTIRDRRREEKKKGEHSKHAPQKNVEKAVHLDGVVPVVLFVYKGLCATKVSVGEGGS